MIRRSAFLALSALASATIGTAAWGDGVEKIVLVRHGEKPEAGLGQLNCQGLNRALALPAVVLAKFGKPAAIFASNPSEQKKDGGVDYDYIRPLATIEPTAIMFGMPVDANHGINDEEGLRAALLDIRFANATVLVAWEHKGVENIARALLKDNGGAPQQVPTWNYADFDSVYIVTITRSGTGSTATFSLAQEGLNGQPTQCPH